jgi:hypothetical protein
VFSGQVHKGPRVHQQQEDAKPVHSHLLPATPYTDVYIIKHKMNAHLSHDLR